MTIRPFHPDDATRVLEIQRASPEASQWNVQSDPGDFCLVAVREQVDGFLLCRQIGAQDSSRNTSAEFELLNMAVDPQARRAGLARALLQAAMQRFVGVWFLEVRESNVAAQKLYESLGFLVCGRRPAYYTNPTETGLVMKQNGDCHEE